MRLVVLMRSWRRVTAVAGAGLVALAVTGCLAHGAPPAPGRARSDVSGTWDWAIQEQNEDGDTRIEREEWHLTQSGKDVGGYYDRVLTVQSGDGRPYECYQDTRYQKFTRFRVAGVIEGGLVTLRETEYETRPDPCDQGRRHMTSYTGSLSGQTLTLRWPPSGMQVLRRRSASGAAAAPAAAPPGARRESPEAPVAPAPQPANASGVWVWEWRAIDANGDERTEREEWRILQRGRILSGQVDRTVRTVSGSGTPWPCSGRPDLTVVVRRDVSGSVAGQHVELTETSAGQIAGAPCPMEERPLYRYEGELGVEDLSLSRGLGLRPDRRILRRVRPMVDLRPR